LGGIAWTVLNIVNSELSAICIVRKVSGIPCPSCGVTRSITSLLNGNWLESININPLGPVMLFFMTILPAWVLLDLYRSSNSLNRAYERMEILLRKKGFYIPFIILLLTNWVWNILKEI
jgi:hypothetical protein